MEKERYTVSVDANAETYEFESIGNKGNIRKRITFRLIELPNIYNLGFGDIDPTTDGIDDLAVTNNGDSQKVLATVAATVLEFTTQKPDALIFATGSTPARTRLYRIGITNHWKEISQYFEVLGYTNNEWQYFEIGTNYEAFLVKRK